MNETTPATHEGLPVLTRRSLLRAAGVTAGAAVAFAASTDGAQAAGLLPSAGDAAPAEQLMLARVWFRRDQDHLLQSFDDTHNAFPDGSLEFLLWPGDLARLQATGLRFTIHVKDVMARDAALFAADRGVSSVAVQPGERAGYRQLADFENDLRALVTRFPTMARLLELPNKTLEGRTVYGIEIATDVDRRDGRPVFYNDGCHHAREWPAAEVPIMWAYDLLESYGKDARITAIVDNVRNIIVPVVNVDGFQYSRTSAMTAAENDTTNTAINTPFGLITKGSYWRKNRRSFLGSHVGAGAGRVEAVNQAKPDTEDSYGVDPNRNYSYQWGDDKVGSASWQASDVYRGEKPLSEAESSNVAWIHKANQVTAMISHHTSGNLVLWAWGDTTDNAPDNKLLEGIGRWCAGYNGYTPQKSIQLYVTTGTASDYAYGVVGSIGFTFEHAGSTFHPPYASTVPSMYAKNRPAMLLLCEEMCLDIPLRPARTGTDAQPAASYNVGYRVAKLNHAIITGQLVDAAGNGIAGTVTLRKRFRTLLWKDGNGNNPLGQKDYEEVLETTAVTAADGTFTYHVNPSTRPYLEFVASKPGHGDADRESYELVAKAGGRGVARDVIVRRGNRIDLGPVSVG